MPTRILRDDILQSERVAALGWAEEVFYRRLMSVADDYGRFHAHPSLIRAACYPLQLNKVSDPDIEKWLACVQKAALVRVYPAKDGKRYLEILRFGQRVQSKSKFPAPPDEQKESTVDHGGSPQPTALVGVEDGEKLFSGSPSGDPPPDDGELRAGKADPIPYQAIVDGYNATMTGLAKVRMLTADRKTAIRKAWQVVPDRSLRFFDAIWRTYADDPFTNGAGPYSGDHANWRPDFDYLIRGKVITRAFERAMNELETMQ